MYILIIMLNYIKYWYYYINHSTVYSCIFSHFVLAQDTVDVKNRGQHKVHLEFLGNSIILYSLNYLHL